MPWVIKSPRYRGFTPARRAPLSVEAPGRPREGLRLRGASSQLQALCPTLCLSSVGLLRTRCPAGPGFFNLLSTSCRAVALPNHVPTPFALEAASLGVWSPPDDLRSRIGSYRRAAADVRVVLRCSAHGGQHLLPEITVDDEQHRKELLHVHGLILEFVRHVSEPISRSLIIYRSTSRLVFYNIRAGMSTTRYRSLPLPALRLTQPEV